MYLNTKSNQTFVQYEILSKYLFDKIFKYNDSNTLNNCSKPEYTIFEYCNFLMYELSAIIIVIIIVSLDNNNLNYNQSFCETLFPHIRISLHVWLCCCGRIIVPKK